MVNEKKKRISSKWLYKPYMFEVSSLPSLWFYRKTMVDHLEKKKYHVTF